MLYVQLDTNWPDHPKIIEAGMDGAGLHAVALCLAKRLESDGWVHRRLLYRQGATDELIGRLVELTLLDAEGDRVRPHGWHRRNPSQAAIDASRASKAEAGRRGNHARHHHEGTFEECGICNPKPQVVAGSDRIGSHLVAVDEPCGPTPTKQSESKAVVATATPAVSQLVARCDARANGTNGATA